MTGPVSDFFTSLVLVLLTVQAVRFFVRLTR